MIRQNQNGRIIADYIELIPEEFALARDQQALLYLPAGSIEWHNNHLPFNTDSIIAENLCRRLAESTGGLILPVNHWGTDCTFNKRGPYQFAPAAGSISLFNAALFSDLLRKIILGVIDNGFHRIVILAGHGGAGDRHSIENVVNEVNQSGLIKAMYMYPYLFTKGCHAGHWETLMLLGLRPDLVRYGKEYIKYNAGTDLTGTESFDEGRKKIDELINTMLIKICEYYKFDPKSKEAFFSTS